MSSWTSSRNYGLHGYIIGMTNATAQHILCGWAIFFWTLFNETDFKPSLGFTLKKIPKIFAETGHGLTDLVIGYAVEFRFQHASIFELNSLIFSSYKKTQTVKALVGIFPLRGGILFSDIYPGSISDSKLTEECGAVCFVESEHEIMSEHGFSIQELSAVRGMTLNRPKQKENDQFAERDIATNFDIAATRIHVESFIGRVCNWGILNSIWPINKIDILSSTWQTVAHIVNLTNLPIGPKEWGPIHLTSIIWVYSIGQHALPVVSIMASLWFGHLEHVPMKPQCW